MGGDGQRERERERENKVSIDLIKYGKVVNGKDNIQSFNSSICNAMRAIFFRFVSSLRPAGEEKIE